MANFLASNGNNDPGVDLVTNHQIGIGTTSPISKLQINDTSDVSEMCLGHGGSSDLTGFIFQHNSLGLFLSSGRHGTDGSFPNTNIAASIMELSSANADSYIALSTASSNNVNATERVRIDKSGNVGIGTTSSNAPLVIYNSNAGDKIVLASHTGNAASIAFATSYDNSPENLSARINTSDDGAWGTHLLFETRTSGPGTTTNERMRITSGGNVGVGTTSPAAKLDVAGDGKFNGQLDMNSNKIVNVTDPTANQDAATKKYVDDKTASTGGGWTDDGTVVRLTTSTDSVGIGTSTADGKVNIAKSNTHCNLNIDTYDDGTALSYLNLRKSDTDTIGSLATTDLGDALGSVSFYGCNNYGGTPDWAESARIRVTQTQNVVSTSVIPVATEMEFFTSNGVNSAPESRLVIGESGLVGINCSPFIGRLSVEDTVSTQLRLGYSSTKYVTFTVDSNGDMNIAPYPSSKGVGIGCVPSSKLDVSGSIESTALAGGSSADLETTAGGVIQRKASDRRLKKNIKTIKGALEKVIQLRGVTFDWKDSNKMGVSDYGLIGQEVEKIVPELISKDKEGFYSVKYTNTVGLLIEAIKEQQAQISALEKKIQKLNGKKSK